MGFRGVRRVRLDWLENSRLYSGRSGWLALVLVTATLGHTSRVTAAGPRVLPPGQLPADTRLGPLKGEEGDFSFGPAKSPEEWKTRSDRVRRIMRVALGLWPMPTSTPLRPVIHGK